MPLEFHTVDDLLDFVSDGGVARTHAQGYEWFGNTLQPALLSVKPQSKAETERLTDCHYVCGDVHDFNNAPQAAIKEYERALSYDPENASAYREIAGMQHNFGDLENARINIERALALDPEDKHAIFEHEYILESLNDSDFIPLFESGNAIWRAYEALAERDPEKTLEILENEQSGEAQRARICALGALERHDAYLTEWARHIQTVEEVFFEYADWFYMPDAIHDAPEIWKTYLKSPVKFTGVVPVFDSLEDNPSYKSLSVVAKVRLAMEYYCYEPAGDKAELKRLHDAYPEWTEVAEALNS